MNSGKIVAGGWTGRDGTGEIEGSTRGPRGPKKCLCPSDQPVLAAIYRRSGVGARIAFAAGKLRRSYSLTFLHCFAVAYQFTAAMYGLEHYSVIFNHSKTSPAHGMAGPLHIQRIINLEKKCWSLSCGLGSNFFLLICGYK